MEKEVIELYRELNAPVGYGWLIQPISEEFVLDNLCLFSQERKCKIYRHFVTEKEEEVVNDKCEKVIYLTIYYQ